MVFGKRLKDLRKKRDLTQQKLAEVSGVHWRTISRLESNPDAVVEAQTLQAISKALDVEPSYFMRKEGADYVGACAWVPLLSAERVACCGRGNHVLDSPLEVEEWIPVPEDYLGPIGTDKPFAMRVSGDPMASSGLPDGGIMVDIVFR